MVKDLLIQTNNMNKYIESIGFQFTSYCGSCSQKYLQYIHPDHPEYLIKIRDKNPYFKLYKKNIQLGYGANVEQLKKVLELYGLVK